MASAAVRIVTGIAPCAVAISSGTHRWTADEPAAKGGGDTGPDPEALLLSSLGACTAITLRMYAARKQWPLTGVEVELALNETSPDGATGIERRLVLRGDLDAAQSQRLLQIAGLCPLHKLLTAGLRIHTTLAVPAPGHE